MQGLKIRSLWCPARSKMRSGVCLSCLVAIYHDPWAQHSIAEVACPVLYEKGIALCIYRACARTLYTDRESDIALQGRILLRYRYVGRSYAGYAEAAIIDTRYILIVKQVNTPVLHGQAIGGVIGAQTVRAGSSIYGAGRHAKISISICKGQGKLHGVHCGTRIGQTHQCV